MKKTLGCDVRAVDDSSYAGCIDAAEVIAAGVVGENALFGRRGHSLLISRAGDNHLGWKRGRARRSDAAGSGMGFAP